MMRDKSFFVANASIIKDSLICSMPIYTAPKND